MPKNLKGTLDGRLWLYKDGRGFIGRGRIELLKQIARLGSISSAARAMKMSYKAAWDAVDAMNNISGAGKPLVSRKAGGKSGGGAWLTDYGRMVVEWFETAEARHRFFLSEMGAPPWGPEPVAALKTTARNHLRGRVAAIKKSFISSEVVVELDGGTRITSIAASEKLKSLGIKRNKRVLVLINTPTVTGGARGRTSATRNLLCGVVRSIGKGATGDEVTIELDGGVNIVAAVTGGSGDKLKLEKGGRACALIDASEIILAAGE